MNKAIIDGVEYELVPIRKEVTSLPDKWYTDGTDEANEWGQEVFSGKHKSIWNYKFISNSEVLISGGDNRDVFYAGIGHTYITPAQFNEWVYKPWKESLKPKAPTTIEEVLEMVRPEWELGLDEVYKGMSRGLLAQLPTEAHAKSVLALCQLYNVAKCLNECFEGEENPKVYYYVGLSGKVHRGHKGTDEDACFADVIRFNSKSAAQHAADHFWHLFQDYYMLEGER